MFMSKHYDLQQSLFGEIVFDDFDKIKKLNHDINDDDFNNGKTYKYLMCQTIFYILVLHVIH
jgi:hypothetical protein